MFASRSLARFSHPVFALILAGALGFLALAGCSDDKTTNPPGGTPGTSSFIGIFTSGDQSGKLTVNVSTASLAGRWGGNRAARATITATGTASLGSTDYALTGTYDTGTDGLTLAGSGFTFGGQYEAGTHGRPNINGVWFGPGGAADHGEFLCFKGSAATVKAYCGVYHSTASSDSGRFSFSVADSVLTGVAHTAGDTTLTGGIYFEGTVTGSGNPRTIDIDYDAGAFTLFAPGTVDTTTGHLSGTYTFTDVIGGGTDDDAGTYVGDLCP